MIIFLTLALCFWLSLSTAPCNDREGTTALCAKAIPEKAAPSTSDTVGNENEYEMMQDLIETGLTINDTYYRIPSALKQFLDIGWSISARTPYFLHPMVGEDYYAIRADWSLSEDKEAIIPGGSIIRLLEKDGLLLEVTIANQTDPAQGEKYQKIEDGAVESITVFYDRMHTSIKLEGMELKSLTPEILQATYPPGDGWTHAPSNYSNHPELGTSIYYSIERNLDNCNRSIDVYFDLNYTAFKIKVLNETPLKFYSE